MNENTLDNNKGIKKFIEKLNSNIFSKIENWNDYSIIISLCDTLGIKYNTFLDRFSGRKRIYGGTDILNKYINNDFNKIKNVIELFSELNLKIDGIDLDKIVNECIKNTLKYDKIDLGIKFVDGKFIEKENNITKGLGNILNNTDLRNTLKPAIELGKKIGEIMKPINENMKKIGSDLGKLDIPKIGENRNISYSPIINYEAENYYLLNNINNSLNYKKINNPLIKKEDKINNKQGEEYIKIFDNLIYYKNEGIFKKDNNEYEVLEHYKYFINLLIDNYPNKCSYDNIILYIEKKADFKITDIMTYKGNLLKLLRNNKIILKKESFINGKNKGYKIILTD